MGLINNLNSWIKSKIVGWLEGEINANYSDRANNMVMRRDYRLGTQKRFLRRSREGYDDNVIGNFLGLALDRGISLLFGKEVEFDFGEDASQETKDFIDGVWEDNNKPILLHKIAMYGGEDGTSFVKLVPDDAKKNGWRIIAQDPVFKDVATDPDDDEKVIRYVTQYKTTDQYGKEVAKRETILVGNWDNLELPLTNWIQRHEINSRDTGGKWVIVDETVWPYAEPPIIHWQNLPMVGNVWGMPDISDDVIEVQDRSNFAISNIGRIIRLFAHPFRWSRGFGGSRLSAKAGNEAEMDTGPDKMPNVDSTTAEITQLEPVGDVPGAVAHAQNLRQIIFDVTRNTDITSMKDKVGALTNFGLRILFFDALNKLETKRNLYGWGLREINRRILLFSDMENVDCKIVWEDPLPQDETALRANFEADLRMGVVDQQTVSERLGYDWDVIKARKEEQQQAQDNVGAMILRAFDRTGGMPQNAGGGTANNGFGKQKQPLAR
jgi:hypothetical protein